MSTDLVLLAALMGLATYPARALPLLVPGLERLPPRGLLYLKLVGPAVLTALALVNTVVVTGPDGGRGLALGLEAAGVAACLGVVAWRRSLFPGLVAGVALVALGRAAGLG